MPTIDLGRRDPHPSPQEQPGQAKPRGEERKRQPSNQAVPASRAAEIEQLANSVAVLELSPKRNSGRAGEAALERRPPGSPVPSPQPSTSPRAPALARTTTESTVPTRAEPAAKSQATVQSARPALKFGPYQRTFYEVAHRAPGSSAMVEKLLHLTRHREGLKLFYYQQAHGPMLTISHSVSDAEAFMEATRTGAKQTQPPEHLALMQTLQSAVRAVTANENSAAAHGSGMSTELRAELSGDIAAAQTSRPGTKLVDFNAGLAMAAIRRTKPGAVDPAVGISSGGHSGGLRLVRDNDAGGYVLSESTSYFYSGATPNNVRELARFFSALLIQDYQAAQQGEGPKSSFLRAKPLMTENEGQAAHLQRLVDVILEQLASEPSTPSLA